MLKAAGLLRDEATDPAALPGFARLRVHGYWTLGGGKISKSVGNVVEALALTRKYGNDAFRYFVLREMPFGQDANFSEEALVERLNADLANDLGNLVSRATTMIVNFGAQTAGATPAPEAADDAIRTLVGETGARGRGGDGRVRLPARARGDLELHRRGESLRRRRPARGRWRRIRRSRGGWRRCWRPWGRRSDTSASCSSRSCRRGRADPGGGG